MDVPIECTECEKTIGYVDIEDTPMPEITCEECWEKTLMSEKPND